MGDFTRFQAPVWDRFFDYISECDDDLSDAQVDEELRRRGIDVTKAFSKVQQALRTAKARAELEAAKNSRPSILERMKGLSIGGVVGSLDEVKRAIAQRFQGGPQVQAAFFRKLDEAESEEDLRTLLEDAQFLDALSSEPNDADPEGE
jgi:hypothetical protein